MSTSISAWPALLGLALPAVAQDRYESPRFFREAALGNFRDLRDVDQDGDVDLAWTRNGSGQTWDKLRLFENDGAAWFTGGTDVSLGVPPAGNASQAGLAVGDVTGDGLPDVVLDIREDVPTAIDSLRIYPGVGAMQLGAPLNHPLAAGHVAHFVLGQIDGDAAREIAVFYRIGTSAAALAWLDWNGAGFSSSVPLALLPSQVVYLEAGDVTGDGVDDLVSFTGANDALQVFPTSAGAATLGQWLPLPSEFVNVNHRFMVGDVLGDGDVDVVIVRRFGTSQPDQTAIVVLENDGTGLLALGPTQTLTHPFGQYAFNLYHPRLVDWDGDGDLDLEANGYSLTLAENDGASGFSFAGDVGTDAGGPDGGPADFDGDGFLDFAAVRAVYIGDGEFHHVGTYADYLSYPTFLSFQRVFDYEGDGDPDLGPNGLGPLYLSDATGESFSSHSPPFPSPPASHVFGSPAGLADFTGDGLADAILPLSKIVGLFTQVFVEMRLVADDGTGAYVDLGTAVPHGHMIPNGGQPWPAADLDGDGDLDLVANGSWYPNGGSGVLGMPVSGPSGSALAFGDAADDGDLDVLTVTGGTEKTVRLFENQGGAVFVEQILASGLSGGVTGLFADLDDDGDTDNALSSDAGNELLVFESAGGTLAGPVVLSSPDGGSIALPLAAEDLDEDGLTDLVHLRRATGEVFGDTQLITWRRRIGPGFAYEPAREWLAYTSDFFADLDQDGDLDALSRSPARILENQRNHGPSAGSIRQYGNGVAGLGGVAPIAGAHGPVAPGSTTAELRLVRAPGGSFAFLALSAGQGQLADFPFAGLTTWLDLAGVYAVLPLAVPGPTGAGKGKVVIPVNVDGGLAGQLLYKQFFVLDPASPSLFTATNGVEIRYGL